MYRVKVNSRMLSTLVYLRESKHSEHGLLRDTKHTEHGFQTGDDLTVALDD